MSEQSGATAATVAVLDVGKTNVKLSALTADGEIVESLSVPNTVMPGPPWQHHDLEGLSDWAFASLRELTHRHALRAVVASGHGVGGVLVGDDPDETSTLPMIDYEQDPPHDITRGYVPLSGSFLDRGSNIMLKATHHARQMYWMQQADPEAFARGALVSRPAAILGLAPVRHSRVGNLDAVGAVAFVERRRKGAGRRSSIARAGCT